MANELIKTETTLQNNLSGEQIELIKRTIAKGATNDELKMFIGQCNRTGLDPFSRQIYAIKRWDSNEGKNVMGVQVSIDGLRLVAQRSKEYEGQTKTEWCGEDGVWMDIWLKPVPPVAARVGVWRTGFREACVAVAKFKSYAVTKKDGTLNTFWSKMPELMIAKVAEALALRKAFPQELSGLYTTEEMSQAGGEVFSTESSVDDIKEDVNLPDTKTDEAINGEVVRDDAPKRTCPFCGSEHSGRYDKCISCWKEERNGKKLVPQQKTKTIINPDKKPF